MNVSVSILSICVLPIVVAFISTSLMFILIFRRIVVVQSDKKTVSAFQKYRVNNSVENGYSIIDDDSHVIKLVKKAVILNIEAKPKSVCWVFEEEKKYSVVHLEITSLEIGYSMEEGWSSDLEDNSIFVIDNESIRKVQMTDIRVVSQSVFMKNRADIAQLSGTDVLKEFEKIAAESSTLGGFKISHCAPMRGFSDTDVLDCQLGLRDVEFDELYAHCATDLSATIHIHGMVGALTASFEYGEPRDFVLESNQELGVLFDRVVVSHGSMSMVHTPREETVLISSDSSLRAEVLPLDAKDVEALVFEVRAAKTMLIRAAWIISAALIFAALIV